MLHCVLLLCRCLNVCVFEFLCICLCILEIVLCSPFALLKFKLSTFWIFSPSTQEYWPVFRIMVSLNSRQCSLLKLVEIVDPWYFVRRSTDSSIYSPNSVNAVNRADRVIAPTELRCRALPASSDCNPQGWSLSFSPFYAQRLEIVYLSLQVNYIPVLLRWRMGNERKFLEKLEHDFLNVCAKKNNVYVYVYCVAWCFVVDENARNVSVVNHYSI